MCFDRPPRIQRHSDTRTTGHQDTGTPDQCETGTMGGVGVPTYRNRVVIFQSFTILTPTNSSEARTVASEASLLTAGARILRGPVGSLKFQYIINLPILVCNVLHGFECKFFITPSQSPGVKKQVLSNYLLCLC